MDNDGIIIGRNAVVEALRAGIAIDKVYIAKTKADAALRHIASTARAAGAAVLETDKRKLDSLCKRGGQAGRPDCNARAHDAHPVHNGVVAMAAFAEYSTIDDIIEYAKHKEERPLIVVCDGISDPHNLGAIIRTCQAAGVHGIIIPKRRNAGLGATVAKVSSGAVFNMKIARVPNISVALRELKKLGVWVFGAEADGEMTLWESDFTVAAALVIGSEGKGISRLVSENCDYMVRIPMGGSLSSLNASVCAAIFMYEAVRQRTCASAAPVVDD